ncbi:MAG: flavodoxin domain-containing protein [Candidatus Omnitrophota bacterium]|nr:flavodoxin domain-containing protein [Candidatus Omnitrophota bacterium]
MKAIEVVKGIYWVGAIDWDIRTFHGHTYETRRGTTYNAYLIVDDKIALIDAVYGPFYQEMLDRIKEIVDPKKIDYMVVNHIETDHSGAVPIIMELQPKAKVVCSAKGKEGLIRHYYGNWDFQVVKTGDTVKLGKRTLRFIEAPMIHWPDSMFTYIPEDSLLLPNDAFGQHLATSKRFNDEVDETIIMDEASKYYANILWPLGAVIKKKIQEIIDSQIKIDMIAPSHGVIWRKNPLKIVEAYLNWASNETKDKVIIAYETMWGATRKMAQAISETFMEKGIETLIYSIPDTDRTDIIADMLDAKAILIGSSTHDNDMLPNTAGFLEFLKGLQPKGRIAAAFGSHGWAGGAVGGINEVLKKAGCLVVEPGLEVKYTPNEEDLASCRRFAEGIIKKIK